jgi:hypothetical protein
MVHIQYSDSLLWYGLVGMMDLMLRTQERDPDPTPKRLQRARLSIVFGAAIMQRLCPEIPVNTAR